MDYKNWHMPAFPNTLENEGYGQGLAKREHFAGLALQGVLAGYLADPNSHPVEPHIAADFAVDYADALLARLAQPEGGDA